MEELKTRINARTMERTIKYIGQFILIFTIWGCIKIDNSVQVQKFRKYTKFQKITWNNKELYPKGEIIGADIIYPGSIEAYGYSGIFIFQRASNEKQFIKFRAELSLISKQRGKIFDSCNIYITDSSFVAGCTTYENPLPDFKNPFSPLNYKENNFTNNTEYFILEYRIGEFFNDKKYSHITNLRKNKEIAQHAISKGVIMNETNRLIVFYFLLW